MLPQTLVNFTVMHNIKKTSYFVSNKDSVLNLVYHFTGPGCNLKYMAKLIDIFLHGSLNMANLSLISITLIIVAPFCNTYHNVNMPSNMTTFRH